MKNSAAYLLVPTIFLFLATPIVQAIQADRAALATRITLAQSMDATISPHCAMKTDNIGSMFMKQNDRIIGIVTEPDSIRKAVGGKTGALCHPCGRNHEQPRHRHRPTRSVSDEAYLMEQRETRQLAVFKDDSSVEILSVRDLLHPVSIDEFLGFVGNVMKEESHTYGV